MYKLAVLFGERTTLPSQVMSLSHAAVGINGCLNILKLLTSEKSSQSDVAFCVMGEIGEAADGRPRHGGGR